MPIPNNRFLSLVKAAALSLAVLGVAYIGSLLGSHAASEQRSSIDAHTHLDDRTPGGVRLLLDTLSREKLTKIIVLVPPYTADDPANYDAEPLLAIARQHPDKIAVVGGGGTLNAMLQTAVTTGDDRPEVQRKFRARAEELANLGVIGFGEMTTEHFPSPGSATYQYAPADHPLMLILADVAAAHNLPIVIHSEAVPQDMPLPSPLKSPPNPPRLHANIDALGRLAAHNPRAKIIWAHAGSDNTGFRTAEICRQMLIDHPNVYMEIKIDPAALGKNPPVDQNGKIKPEWLALYQEFPDRFVLGSDQHYPEGKGKQRWQAAADLLGQLPPDLRERIGTENPKRIYGIKAD